MRIDACEDKAIRLEFGKEVIKGGTMERAVSLLHDDRIGRGDRQVRNNLAPWCSLYRDANASRPHFRKRVPKIGLEFLTNPDNGPILLSHDADKRVRRVNKLLF